MEVYRGLLENIAQLGLEGVEFHFLSVVFNGCAELYDLTRAIIFYVLRLSRYVRLCLVFCAGEEVSSGKDQ
jgi:hypothetical protein